MSEGCTPVTAPLPLPNNADLLERVTKARAAAFPHSTDPASRHAAMIGEYLLKDKRYMMLTEEPEHCGESILCTVAGLWETRVALAATRPAPSLPEGLQRRLLQILEMYADYDRTYEPGTRPTNEAGHVLATLRQHLSLAVPQEPT